MNNFNSKKEKPNDIGSEFVKAISDLMATPYDNSKFLGS